MADRYLFKVEGLDFAYPGAEPLFHDFNLVLPEGEVICIVGQNGCGKSTLLNLLGKNLIPKAGEISLTGHSLRDFKRKDFAQAVAIVHQQNRAPNDLTVEDLVSYGRIPHNPLLAMRLNEKDWAAVDRALAWTNTESLRKREIGTLSYGQLQRVWIAMALAQETKTLFLDEPTNFLDIRFQIEVLSLIKSLNRDKGMNIVMVLHDINQAIAYCDRVVALKEGELLMNGPVNDFLDRKLLRNVYDIDLTIAEYSHQHFVLTV